MATSLDECLRKMRDEEEVVLQGMNIASIEPIIHQLSSMPRLRSLRLADNRLTSLPDDMSGLAHLETLDMTDNAFPTANAVLKGLISLPRLKHLSMTLADPLEEDTLIISLISLETFNGTKLNGNESGPLLPLSSRGGPEHQQPAIRHPRSSPHPAMPTRSEGGDGWWKQAEELHHVLLANCPYELRPTEDFPEFKQRVERFLGTLNEGQSDADLAAGEELKARRVLADYCFEEQIAVVENAEDGALDLHQVAQSLRAVQRHYSTLLNEYDQHWRALHHRRQHRDEAIRSEVSDALGELESLMRGGQTTPSQLRRGAMNSSRGAPAEKGTPRGYSAGAPAMTTPGRGMASDRGPSRSSARRRSLSAAQRKVLSLRQLLELIENIYTSKQKYDEQCASHGLPSETMEHHMYTFLNQRYGLREIILDYASAIIDGTKTYAAEQNEVAVFAKILRNDIDEGFRFVQRQIRTAVPDLLLLYWKNKSPHLSDTQLQAIVTAKVASELTQPEWSFIVGYMYAPEDATSVKNAILHHISSSTSNLSATPGQHHRIHFEHFVRILLDFQLDGHEHFLSRYVAVFRKHDVDGDGVVNHEEFTKILEEQLQDDTIVRRISQRLDAQCGLLTFSETVGVIGEDIHLFAPSATKPA